jgi:hypothetical protein
VPAAFAAFWDHVHRAERHVEQYCHTGYFDGWEEHVDEEFWDAFRRIDPSLGTLKAQRPFRQPRGLPNDGPIIVTSGHEGLVNFLNPPERLFGAPHALLSPEYQAIRDAAEDELDQVVRPPAPATPDQSAGSGDRSWRPVVKFAFDGEGRLVLSCHSRPKRRTVRVVLKNQQRDVFLVLTSAVYRAVTACWDEFLWNQIWGTERRDGKAKEKYERDRHRNGSDGGVNSRIKGNVYCINQLLSEEFGTPPGGKWFQRGAVRRAHGHFDSAYVPNERVKWVDQVGCVPAEFDAGP